jgi:hypothetical protein
MSMFSQPAYTAAKSYMPTSFPEALKIRVSLATDQLELLVDEG